MKERKNSNLDRHEASSDLFDPLTPPTFTQKLHNWWQIAPATTRVAAVLVGVLTTSLLASTMGVAGMKLGDIFQYPALTEAGKLMTLTAASIGIASPLVAMLALTFFEERLKPSSRC